jgi:hypothetical protein
LEPLLFVIFIFFYEWGIQRNILLEIFKGKCDFLHKKCTLTNEYIAGSSFHYGGYLTGYVIWGFIIQYVSFVLLGIIIIIVKSSFGNYAFLRTFLILLPILLVAIFKRVIYQITKWRNIVFLQKNTKIRALDNFRAFNILLFFDCFILGIIEALIRLVKVVIFLILYMPRIAYGFIRKRRQCLQNLHGLFIYRGSACKSYNDQACGFVFVLRLNNDNDNAK